MLLTYAYVAVKHGILVAPSKFEHGFLQYLVVAMLYFVPVLLFVSSAWLLWVTTGAEKGVWVRAITALALIYAGYSVVLFMYGFIDPSLGNYLYKLNEGYYNPKSEDFRLEYLIVFAFNLFMFVRLADKKIQTWRVANRTGGGQS